MNHLGYTARDYNLAKPERVTYRPPRVAVPAFVALATSSVITWLVIAILGAL